MWSLLSFWGVTVAIEFISLIDVVVCGVFSANCTGIS